jgi:hypothetical protein
MKIHSAFLTLAAVLALHGLSFAGPKTYQVTGPITAVTDTSITVQKGKESWEVARDANTKITGDLKVGSKVTIEYTMTATTATVSEAKKDDKPKGDKKKSS